LNRGVFDQDGKDMRTKQDWRHTMRRRLQICLLVVPGLVLSGYSSLWAGPITYTSDPNVAHFTSLVSSYATFSNFSGGDVSSPFTPTSAEIASSGFRVFAGGSVSGLPGGNNWILATFTSAVSSILVFPNIDHFGSAYDGYQYTIEGSNDGTTWTPLFDALTVTGAGEPFTLGTFSGTAPLSVNNVLTPGAGPGGTVGYEAHFSFGTSYKFYAFGASMEAFNSGNADQELSAVGAAVATPVPEPATMSLTVLGLAGAAIRRRRRSRIAL
jgi:hypothetical protein